MSTRALTLFALCLAAVTLNTGCRQNMHNQNKVKGLRASAFFKDGRAARRLPAHTVARGDLREGPAYSGLGANRQPVAICLTQLLHGGKLA